MVFEGSWGILGPKEKLDPFQLFWQHSSVEQKLSLLEGCPLASGNRPALQKQRHVQEHDRIRDPDLVQSLWKLFCEICGGEYNIYPVVCRRMFVDRLCVVAYEKYADIYNIL